MQTTKKKHKSTKPIFPLINFCLLAISLYLIIGIVFAIITPTYNTLHHMTIPILTITLCVLVTISFILLILNLKREPILEKRIRNRSALKTIIILNIISIFIVFGFSLTVTITKAMMPTYMKNHSLPEISTINQKTPLASTTEPQPGDIVILYKFGCPDCEGIYESANETFTKENISVKWISTDTDIGKKLCEKYNISWTPTGLYLKKQPLGNGADAIQEQLDSVINKETYLNEQNAQTLIDAYKNNE